MIGKNNISFGDFLMIREKLKGLNGYGRKAEVALKACSRILDAGLDARARRGTSRNASAYRQPTCFLFRQAVFFALGAGEGEDAEELMRRRRETTRRRTHQACKENRS
jgi:hypothetical protein